MTLLTLIRGRRRKIPSPDLLLAICSFHKITKDKVSDSRTQTTEAVVLVLPWPFVHASMTVIHRDASVMDQGTWHNGGLPAQANHLNDHSDIDYPVPVECMICL